MASVPPTLPSSPSQNTLLTKFLIILLMVLAIVGAGLGYLINKSGLFSQPVVVENSENTKIPTTKNEYEVCDISKEGNAFVNTINKRQSTDDIEEVSGSMVGRILEVNPEIDGHISFNLESLDATIRHTFVMNKETTRISGVASFDDFKPGQAVVLLFSCYKGLSNGVFDISQVSLDRTR